MATVKRKAASLSLSSSAAACKHRLVDHADWAREQFKEVGAVYFQSHLAPFEEVQSLPWRLPMYLRLEVLSYLLPRDMVASKDLDAKGLYKKLKTFERVLYRQLSLYMEFMPYFEDLMTALECKSTNWWSDIYSPKYIARLPRDEDWSGICVDRNVSIPLCIFGVFREFISNGAICFKMGSYQACESVFGLVFTPRFYLCVSGYVWELEYCRVHGKYYGRFSVPPSCSASSVDASSTGGALFEMSRFCSGCRAPKSKRSRVSFK